MVSNLNNRCGVSGMEGKVDLTKLTLVKASIKITVTALIKEFQLYA